MGDAAASILDGCEESIEEAIWEEESDRTQGLATLAGIVERLRALDLEHDDGARLRRQGLLAMALMREANLHRQTGDLPAAAAADEAALSAAETADALSRGCCLLSMAGTRFASGDPDQGMLLLLEARRVFDPSAGPDHMQGIGWSWLLEADVANAGLMEGGPMEAVAAAARALGILRPIDNWAGIARVYEAMAAAEEKSGDAATAEGLADIAARYQARASAEHQ
ncbi:MAG: hypothetical protein MUP76_06070 [Acidimicrobiia bacterium]|nr:hypothetical protein [Acidimicrobiia bacterium]